MIFIPVLFYMPLGTKGTWRLINSIDEKLAFFLFFVQEGKAGKKHCPLLMGSPNRRTGLPKKENVGENNTGGRYQLSIIKSNNMPHECLA